MRILFLGDIVGKPGYTAVLQNAEFLRAELRLDALVANAENASDGSGIMPRQFQRLTGSGVDAITLGDHIYRRKEILETLESSDRIVKPANYPRDATGRQWILVKTKPKAIARCHFLVGSRLHAAGGLPLRCNRSRAGRNWRHNEPDSGGCSCRSDQRQTDTGKVLGR